MDGFDSRCYEADFNKILLMIVSQLKIAFTKTFFPFSNSTSKTVTITLPPRVCRSYESLRSRCRRAFTTRLTPILGFNCFLRFSRLLLKGSGLDCNWLKGIKSAVARPLPRRPTHPPKTAYFSPHLWSNFDGQWKWRT